MDKSLKQYENRLKKLEDAVFGDGGHGVTQKLNELSEKLEQLEIELSNEIISSNENYIKTNERIKEVILITAEIKRIIGNDRRQVAYAH